MNVESPSALLRRRCVLIRGEISDETVTACIASLLYLGYESPRQPATLYVDSTGGSVTASRALLQTMDELSFPLAKFCCGFAGGTAGLILAHGLRGFRTAGPDASFAFSPCVANPGRGYVEPELAQIDHLLIETLAEDTRRHEAELAGLFHSRATLGSAAALALGMIDSISSVPVIPPWSKPTEKRWRRTLGLRLFQ